MNIDFNNNKLTKPKCRLTLTTNPPVLYSDIAKPIPKLKQKKKVK